MKIDIDNLVANIEEVINALPSTEYLSHTYDEVYMELYIFAAVDKIKIDCIINFWDGESLSREDDLPGYFPWMHFTAELIKRGYITF